ncbi:hypothetical protein ABBQ32_001800 [Trebouxia sp. C0010 RCD-2024]
MSTSLAHTPCLNLRISNKRARPYVQIRVANKRLQHAKTSRYSPCGSFAAAHRRTVTCKSAEEVLELSEESVAEVLQDSRQELMQLFDESVGMTGTVELAELDGPFVKLRLQGRFWHKKADVLARVAAYLQRRIPDIMEIDIEDESQLDDSAANF